MSYNQFHQQNYAAWNGTSMACPNTAAVAGLLKAANPMLSDDDLEQLLYNSADDIDDLNPEYAGQLGAGRVNARRAMMFQQLGYGWPAPNDLEAGVIELLGFVTLTWESPDADYDPLFYNVFRNGQLLATSPDTTFDDAPPVPAQEYTYRVNAVYPNGVSMPTDPVSIYYRDIAHEVLLSNFDFQFPATWDLDNDPLAPWEWQDYNPAPYATPFMLVQAPGNPDDFESDLLIDASIDLDPWSSVEATGVQQGVPASAETGLYTYYMNAGAYPDDVMTGRWFRFVKGDPNFWGAARIADNDAAPPAGWITRGWPGMQTTGGEQAGESNYGLPERFAVESVYPNPFNPVASITVALPERAELAVTVFNVIGREVARLADGPISAGRHTFTFDGSSLSSGVYFVHAEVPGELDALRKLTLVK
ncbi:MAG: hypothetical protein MAG453_00776 [Calditrichaeota bacterium]|nr:hypothetical protein [Calditrichota bacterium]